ncbi:MAG: hypothetical protein ACK5CY_12155, partial [Bacteroidia bacterium]
MSKMYFGLVKKCIKYRYCILCLFLALLNSCASYKYDSYDKRSNSTVNIYSDNVQDFVAINGTEESKSNNGKLALSISLKRKKTTIDLIHPNYEQQTITVKRSVRGGPLAKDILLSPLTFGLPIIIDVFRSDFYKVNRNTKEFKIHFEYKQSFMRDEYYSIYDSSNPEEFSNWLSLYPKSEIKGRVLRHRDSLELNIALNKKTEYAIDEFISSHQNSHFLPKAKSIKSEMVAAREMFQASLNTNSVEAYENFLAKYPQSLHTTEAFERLIDAAERRAINKNNIDAIRDYVKEYLM